MARRKRNVEMSVEVKTDRFPEDYNIDFVEMVAPNGKCVCFEDDTLEFMCNRRGVWTITGHAQTSADIHKLQLECIQIFDRYEGREIMICKHSGYPDCAPIKNDFFRPFSIKLSDDVGIAEFDLNK